MRAVCSSVVFSGMSTLRVRRLSPPAAALVRPAQPKKQSRPMCYGCLQEHCPMAKPDLSIGPSLLRFRHDISPLCTRLQLRFTRRRLSRITPACPCPLARRNVASRQQRTLEAEMRRNPNLEIIENLLDAML